jgi:hypothetical protein
VYHTNTYAFLYLTPIIMYTVPHTMRRGQEGGFILRVFSSGPVVVEQVTPLFHIYNIRIYLYIYTYIYTYIYIDNIYMYITYTHIYILLNRLPPFFMRVVRVIGNVQPRLIPPAAHPCYSKTSPYPRPKTLVRPYSHRSLIKWQI